LTWYKIHEKTLEKLSLGWKMKQKELAKRLNMTEGRLSQIFRGDSVGKKAAQSMGDLTGRPWTDFLIMEPEIIKEVLQEVE